LNQKIDSLDEEIMKLKDTFGKKSVETEIEIKN